MRFNFLGSPTPQSSLRVFIKQFLKQVFQERIGNKVQRWLLIADLFLYHFEFLMLHKKRRKPSDHLKNQAAESPPVYT